ncbi:type IV secretion protein Rhs, partial [Pseudomonas sp. SDI]|uniref:DUF6531 domain-containing protein n=1 Tax=Pseudomonas sp. SDI TaxID=2170734 RepID=UPI000DE63E31
GGFLAGAALGIALVGAVAFATVTCGAGLALMPVVLGLVAGVAAGALGSQLVEWGEGIGRMISAPAGGIAGGSPNVFINGLPAAYATASPGLCDKHPSPPPLIAEGSGKVFINGQPAARNGDRLTCGGRVNSGSPNVFIGGEPEVYLEIQDEVPDWLRTTVEYLMVAAGLVGGLGKTVLLAGKGALKAVAPCALKYTAGFVAGEVAGQYIVGPALTRMLGGLFGHPVDAVNGRKILLEDGETDFVLPGLMPISWGRFYASNLSHEGLLGRGWVLPWEQSLRLAGEQVILRDNQGRELALPRLQPRERVYFADEQFALVCSEGGHYLLHTLDNQFFYFGELAPDGEPAALRRIENALGQFQHFHYDEHKRLSDINAVGGIRVHLCYDGERLSRVERVIDNQPVEVLVRYQYDADGQLAQVTDRNGAHVRRFRYADGLMVCHENALGLRCEYQWAHFADGPRVIDHKTSDGERYLFSYDLEARCTRVRDPIGRNAEIHYNEQLRVIASQDYGGERYAIQLDAAGNMLGLTLPDDSELAFTYDELSRLTEEKDPLGRSTRYTYHLDTTLLSAIERPDGSGEQWRYDSQGVLLDSTDALGGITRYQRHDNGLPHTQQDPLGNTTHLWWNAFGLLEKYQDCSGQQTRYGYDQRLHLVSVTDALNHTTTITRRPSGEVLRLQGPVLRDERYSYNALGQVLSHSNADGHTTAFEYSPRGLPTRRKDPRGSSVRYFYDLAQRLNRLTNENGESWRFRYDPSDRLQEETGFDGLRRDYRYDVRGLLVESTEYSREDHLELSRSQQFEHDAAGRLLSKITEDARLDYRYDDGDRVLAIERQPSALGRKRRIDADRLSFKYDLAGRLLEERGVLGPVAYQYDAL